MKLLLDTHTFIWMMTDVARLSPRARAALADANNERFVSVASIWEMAIKVSLKRLDLDLPLETFMPTALEKGVMVELPVLTEHAIRVASLPLHHRDPFDRLLIAQAQVESLAILSVDPLIAQYDVKVIW